MGSPREDFEAIVTRSDLLRGCIQGCKNFGAVRAPELQYIVRGLIGDQTNSRKNICKDQTLKRLVSTLFIGLSVQGLRVAPIYNFLEGARCEDHSVVFMCLQSVAQPEIYTLHAFDTNAVGVDSIFT